MGSTWAVGNFMYVDLNGDGEIEAESTTNDLGDIKKIGNSTPRFRTCITLNLAYRGFDLQMFWQGVLKRDWYPTDNDGNGSLMFLGVTRRGEWWSTALDKHMDYFRADADHPLGQNLNSYYTRPIMDWGGADKNQRANDHYLQDASYMRLKNLQIGYTFPEQWTSKACLHNLRIYMSGENLLTFTKMSSTIDPELAGYGYGGGGTAYPLSKVFSFGLSVNF